MFDSGFGGLTVARATIDLLPEENLIYLGDNARYPYGAKPLDEVLRFSLEIADYLVNERKVKALVIACNTATAAALAALRTMYDIPILGVIEPGLRALVQASVRNRVGVIGTIGTVESGEYERAMANIEPNIFLRSYACPGFVEFVERGELVGRQVMVLAERLLAPVLADEIDTLLLGCTHYPYLARVISDVVGRSTVLVSSADETAFALMRLLSELDLQNGGNGARGHVEFVSSGDIVSFTRVGSRLLGPELGNAKPWTPPSQATETDS